MSRTTNINVNVQSGQSIATISKLKQAFIDLKKAKDSIGKNGKMIIDIDVKGLDAKALTSISKSINKISKSVETLKTTTSTLASSGVAFNTINNNINNNIVKTTKSVDTMSSSLKQNKDRVLESAIAFEMMRRTLTAFMDGYNKLTSATFNVGIASQMSLNQIESLNKAFLTLSTTVPSSAYEMAQAVDGLIRTGRSFDESRKIIEQVAILATASGDSLKDTSAVVTKVMVSLGINADRVVDTLTTMHSTAIQTASDMGYLAEAFKNVAGVASVLTKQSGLSGKELDDYKQKILDISMASIGSMANLGLSASQSGTKIKNLFNKLVATEKSARALFDTSMKLNNVKFENFDIEGKKGQLFDYSALSNMAKTDLPKALNILSEMYVKGQLSTQTMQKMFTARHFMEISNLLIDINGNVDSFVNRLAKGVDYSNDFYKKMFDVNEQMKLFKNNLEASLGGVGGNITKGLTGALMALNNYIPDMNKGIGSLISNVGSLGLVVGLTTASVGVLAKTIAPYILAGGGIGIALGALVATIGLIGKNVYETNKTIADTNINLDKSLLINKQIESQLGSNYNLQQSMNRLVKDAEEMQKSRLVNIDEESTMMGLLLGKNKELRDMLESINKAKSIDESMLPKIDESQMKALKESIENEIAQSSSIIKNGLDTYLSKIEMSRKDLLDNFSGTIDKMGTISSEEFDETIAKYDDKIAKSKELYAELLKLVESGTNIEERTKFMHDYGKKIGMTEKEVNHFLKNINIAGIEESIKVREESYKKLKEYNEMMKESYKSLTEQITANNKAINMVTSRTNQVKLDLFEKTGKYKGKEGFAGLFEIFEESNIQQYSQSIDAINSKIKSLIEEKETLEKQKSIKVLDENEEKRLSEIDVILKSLNEEHANGLKLKEQGFGVDKDSLINSLQGIQYTSKTANIMLEILKIKQEIARLEIVDPNNIALIEALKNSLTSYTSLLKVESDITKSKQKQTEYQIKYRNYLKDNLDLELELAKVLQTQGKQQTLIYEFKKKQLRADLEINKQEIEVSRETLKKLGSNKFANITSVAQGQTLIDSFYKQHKGGLKGEGGKKLKDEYEALKQLVSDLGKQEKLSMELALVPLKEFDSIMKSMPKNIEDVYKTLLDLSSTSGVFESYGTELNNFFKDNLNMQIKMFNDSYTEMLSPDNLSQVLKSSTQELLSMQKDIVPIMQQRKDGKELNEDEEKKLNLYIEQTNKVKDLVDLNKELADNAQRELDIRLKILDAYIGAGDVISKLGSSMGLKPLEDIGNLFSGFGDVSKSMKKNKFNFNDLFKDVDTEKWASNFSNAMESALSNIDFGSMVGSFVGNITGGGASSQAGGALGGAIAGAGGANALAGALGMAGSALATGGASLAISAGMALIGGMFEDDGSDQEEANRRSAEAKKIYDKNTEALNKLAQNMSNLSGGVDGLNSTLLSTFSKLPTVGKLTRVEDTLRDMYKTMEMTRKFNDVAYQVTKTKKGKKGFMGIGATAGSTWTETIEVSVQELLKKYGFKGTIEEMTTQEMRDFSKWLEDFDMGDTDNFSILAGAIEDYAEALDKFDKNIDKFFRDATLESFAGISVSQEDQLRQQIEEFYKNLGFQIDETMSKEIDKMVENMSVMVTIMQDVRSNFIKTWRDSGKDAGSAFLSSMSPYIDAMLENLSQIFYDVYFSDVTDTLEKEFKVLSEQLVELKKQGGKLDWSTVANSLSSSFDKVLTSIISAKQETESFNTIILQLQKQALEAGLSLSELMELGLVSGTQKDVLNSFKDALLSSSNDDVFQTIGSMVGDKIGGALADKMLDNMLSDRILQFSASIDKIASGNLSFDSLAGLANEAMSVGMMLSEQQKRLQAIKDMFDFNKDIVYQSQESNIEYQTGTSTQVVNNYYINSNVEAGVIVESDSIEAFIESNLDIILEKLKVNRGIDLTNR